MKVKPLIFFALTLLIPSVHADTQSEPVPFSRVLKTISDPDGNLYLITDAGTYRVTEEYFEKVDVNSTAKVPRSSYPSLLPEEVSAKPQVDSDLELFVAANLLIVLVLIFYFQNLLKRKAALAADEESKERQTLALLYWANNDTVLDCDLRQNTCRVLNQNPNIQLSDDSPHLKSKVFLSQVHPEDRERVREYYKSLINNNKSRYEISYRIVTESDKCLWLIEQGILIDRDNSGELNRLICNIKDVTASQQEHDALVLLVKELKRRLKIAESAQLSE